jgi:hypothetical protein
MPGRPLHQLDPVAVGIGESRCLRALRASRMLLRAGPQSPLRHRLEGGGELVHPDDELAEPDYVRRLAELPGDWPPPEELNLR